ncbi:hypothetical protein OIO90_003639 [Microbotryomycetes sp. JL221]|nr:hypothetical protein OIO90_003639 [Microbotryomycetes sp. JL221]
MTITLISNAPPALDREGLAEITSSTPSSFENVAPYLRYKDEDCQIIVEPAFEGFERGQGQLFVTEEALSFFSPETCKGISIPYPHITLHAISRTPISTSEVSTTNQTTQQPCIYCQVDEIVVDDNVDEVEGISREVMIVPKDPTTLDKLFDMISYCASLHPPPHADNPSSLFGGLDPDSLVYADDQGNLIGPGVTNGDEAWQDADDDDNDVDNNQNEQQTTAGGRVRSDFVNDNRTQPY